ncbi:MAG: hypothetical protein Q9187_003622 [Circinaria calcarea]
MLPTLYYQLIARLDAAAFKPSKDQRQVLNRLSKHVLGQEYLRKAARLCPKSRQYAILSQLVDRTNDATCSPNYWADNRSRIEKRNGAETILTLARSLTSSSIELSNDPLILRQKRP